MAGVFRVAVTRSGSRLRENPRVTLGRADHQGDLFDEVARFCEESLPENSIYGFLARERARLSPDELFADLFTETGGVAYDQLGVTGFGVAEAADSAAEHIGRPLGGARVAIQGFGAVGRAAAERFVALGATVVAISTTHGALHDPSGLDVAELVRASATSGDAVVTRPGRGTALRLGQELLVDCDRYTRARRAAGRHRRANGR